MGSQKPVVPVGHQLPVARQLLQRLPFEDGVVTGQVVEDAVLEDEEAAVDPTRLGLRLLEEVESLGRPRA